MTDIRQIALDTLKSGAPGLSEQTREVIAGIIARKANLTTTPVAETAGEAVGVVSGCARADLYTADLPMGTPLYAAPVPAQDDDKLRIAVEALETIKNDKAKVVKVHDARHVAAEALAALKSEGK
jgi:hypothetical protein